MYLGKIVSMGNAHLEESLKNHLHVNDLQNNSSRCGLSHSHKIPLNHKKMSKRGRLDDGEFENMSKVFHRYRDVKEPDFDLENN